MKVIIAEKPSVAKNIAEATGSKQRRDGYYEGDSYYVTWAFGHLLELYDSKDYDDKMGSWKMDHFPFVPEAFLYKVKRSQENKNEEDKGAKKQLEIIRHLIDLEAVDGVISACDYDREGQIIGDIIFDYLEVKKPIERLLLNEWTADEVSNGLKKVVDNLTMSPLKSAGISRQWTDWLIGINLTSVATLKYQRGFGKALNIGRVLLPTLKIIYDRDLEIENFEKKSYHKLSVTFLTPLKATYEAIYTRDGIDKFEAIDEVKSVAEGIAHQQGIIKDRIVEDKKEYPPPLFNLSGLQGHMTSKEKGWTSEKVLKVAQNLYEKKLITYPRTASLALEESLVDKAMKVLNVHKKNRPYENQIVFHKGKRVFDNQKVESHSAIMPTYMVGKGLNRDEMVVYQTIVNRFIMQFMPVAEHEEVTLITEVNNKDQFIAKGRTQKIEGWRLVENIQSKEKLLPKVEKNELVDVVDYKIETKSTSPPKAHTEKSLLKIMETCGKRLKNKKETLDDQEEDEDQINEEDEETIQAILSGFSIGTPATRAEIITKLKRVGYIEAKGKSLKCTSVGRRLVEKFPVKSLFDLEYTGRMEKRLFDIGKSALCQEEFLSEIYAFVNESVKLIKTDDFHVIQDLEKGKELRESLGKCPNCGSDVVEGKKGFGCANWKSGCKFVVWKEDAFLKTLQVTPSAQTIKRLLENGEVYSTQFVSKKGKKFSAYLRYEKTVNEETKQVFYQWKMRF